MKCYVGTVSYPSCSNPLISSLFVIVNCVCGRVLIHAGPTVTLKHLSTVNSQMFQILRGTHLIRVPATIMQLQRFAHVSGLP